VIVVASDGVFDNLYIKDIKLCLQPQIDSNGFLSDLQEAANCLAEKSEKLGDDSTYFSPFAKNARDENIHFTGGKADDITVIVAQVI